MGAVTARPALRSRQFQFDGIELSAHEAPAGGRPFVLLHGLTGHRDDFIHRLPDLAGEAWWLAPDLRGHGDFSITQDETTFCFDRLVRDLGEVLDAIGADDCDLLGHSFGGMVALRFALEFPQRVNSLVLMATAPHAPKGYEAETFRKAGALACSEGMSLLQEIVEKQWRNEPDANDAPSARWADIYWPHHRKRYCAMDPVAYGSLGVLMVEQEPVADRLAEIVCPTSVWVGSRDDEFLDGSRTLAAGIPEARFVCIEGAGHHPHMENPDVWLEAMRAHLARTLA